MPQAKRRGRLTWGSRRVRPVAEPDRSVLEPERHDQPAFSTIDGPWHMELDCMDTSSGMDRASRRSLRPRTEIQNHNTADGTHKR